MPWEADADGVMLFVESTHESQGEDVSQSICSHSSDPTSQKDMSLSPDRTGLHESAILPSWDEQLFVFASSTVPRATTPLSLQSYESDNDSIQRDATPCPCPSPVNIRQKIKSKYPRIKSQVPMSENALALENLQRLERQPRHMWTAHERRILVVLNRFYEREPEKFTIIFNVITDNELSVQKVTTQFENHIRLHGKKAFPFYGEVFSVSPMDRQGIYAPIRLEIEDVASAHGFNLTRKLVDTNIISGTAAYAKSPRTRHRYTCLVRQASDPLLYHSMFNRAIRTLPIDSELWVKVGNNEYLESVNKGKAPCLAFRAWNQDSHTSYDHRGFVSDRMKIWQGQFPPPIPGDSDSEALLANLHFSRKTGNCSFFVSCITSLVQALTFAQERSDACIALIDLTHASLLQQNKRLDAYKVLASLKAKGQAQWAKRYQAHGEYMFWYDIPKEAIISVVSIKKLEAALNDVPNSAKLFSLEQFTPGLGTPKISQRLKAQNTTISNSTADAMGTLAALLGLRKGTVSTGHISDFVARLVSHVYSSLNAFTNHVTGGWLEYPV
ncbi:hypothetical protein P280DRAFT_255175 [Massarina eburnea CBS 473.64]|uniref:DUF7587 domain-containing protein n=1 Tax=Massarina eburnea CBS 473.64 TaxID=1395130 RepID=A0A6A6SAT4_9PLEO|nr:hypothetical protein P280DRAFT_255175 [Massarina eburnea CBS 473.64]